MLKISDLKVTVDGKAILNGLNLEVGPGEVHAIMGPNGSGKSSLANVIAGRDGYEVTGGSVSFMENEAIWHGQPPGKEDYERAIAEL